MTSMISEAFEAEGQQLPPLIEETQSEAVLQSSIDPLAKVDEIKEMEAALEEDADNTQHAKNELQDAVGQQGAAEQTTSEIKIGQLLGQSTKVHSFNVLRDGSWENIEEQRQHVSVIEPILQKLEDDDIEACASLYRRFSGFFHFYKQAQFSLSPIGELVKVLGRKPAERCEFDVVLVQKLEELFAKQLKSELAEAQVVQAAKAHEAKGRWWRASLNAKTAFRIKLFSGRAKQEKQEKLKAELAEAQAAKTHEAKGRWRRASLKAKTAFRIKLFSDQTQQEKQEKLKAELAEAQLAAKTHKAPGQPKRRGIGGFFASCFSCGKKTMPKSTDDLDIHDPNCEPPCDEARSLALELDDDNGGEANSIAKLQAEITEEKNDEQDSTCDEAQSSAWDSDDGNGGEANGTAELQAEVTEEKNVLCTISRQ